MEYNLKHVKTNDEKHSVPFPFPFESRIGGFGCGVLHLLPAASEHQLEKPQRCENLKGNLEIDKVIFIRQCHPLQREIRVF